MSADPSGLPVPENLVSVVPLEALRETPLHLTEPSKVVLLAVLLYKRHTVTNLSAVQLIATYIGVPAPLEPSVLAVAETVMFAEIAVAVPEPVAVEDQTAVPVELPVPLAKVKSVQAGLQVSPPN